MVITQEFQQAVAQHNLLRIKIMLKDSLLVDPSFRQFDNMIHIVEQEKIKLWIDDSEDDIVLPENKTQWNDEYLNKTLAGLVHSFSKKRIRYLKKVIVNKYPIRERNNGQKPETMSKADKWKSKIQENCRKITKRLDSELLKNADINEIKQLAKEISGLCDKLKKR